MHDVADALRFVRGAVAKRDYVPALTHFRIKDGSVMGFNGRLTLCHPIDLSLDVAPKAALFEKALAAVPLGVPIAVDMTAAGRLAIRAGGFKVFVPCIHVVPDGMFDKPKGDMVPLEHEFLSIIKELIRFVSLDASRAWSQAILFHGHGAFATNNQIIVERWCDKPFVDRLVVPLEAAKELLRVNVEPIGYQIDERSVTFHFPNGAWMRTALLTDPWPEKLTEIVAQKSDKLVAVPKGFDEDIARLSAFVEDTGLIVVEGATFSTSRAEGLGASIELECELGDGCFHIETLKLLASIATTVDLWSVPAVFRAPRIRGVALNMRG